MSETIEQDKAENEGVLQRAVKRLENLASVLGDANTKEDRADAWATVQDADTISAIAEAYNENPTEIERHLSLLGTFNGCATRANQFAKGVVRMARTLTAQDRASSLLNSLGTVATVLDRCPPESLVPTSLLAKMRVPRGWMLSDEGVSKINPDSDPSRISLAPMFLIGRAQDVTTGEAHRTLCWKGSTGWCARVVPRAVLSEARKLTALSEFEAPIHSNNAASLVSYLAEFEAENGADLPLVHSTGRLGWMPDGAFVFPERRMLPPGGRAVDFALTAPPGFEGAASGITVKGTWEGWLEAAEIARDWPFLMIGIYGALAASLLHVIDHPSFVIDFNGETTGGKTTTLKLAASCIGRAKTGGNSAMFSWDMTKVWLEQTAGFMGNLPVILDDTKRAKSNRVIRDVIYDFSFGSGRGRGAKAGGTRAMSEWKSVLLSSGETAITSFGQDGGTRARVLEFRGKPLGVNPAHGAKLSEQLQEITTKHYGHMSRRFVEYLVSNKEHWEQIQHAFDITLKKYSTALRTPVSRRHAGNLAALEIAGEIAHTLGLPRPRVDVWGPAIRAAERAGADSDRPLAALISTLNWCVANPNYFYGSVSTGDRRGELKVPPGGFAGVWSTEAGQGLGIRRRSLSRILSEEDYHPPEIIDRWQERGWISEDSKIVRGPGNARWRCMEVTAKAIALALGDGPVEPLEPGHLEIEE